MSDCADLDTGALAILRGKIERSPVATGRTAG